MGAKTELPKRAESARKILARASLWLGGSAFLGSVALVLWNRQLLKSMREASKATFEPNPPRDDDGIY